MPVQRQTRSPLKERALNRAGESGYDSLLEFAFRKLLTPWLFTLFVGIVAWMEWLHYWLKSPPMPFFSTILFCLSALTAAVWSWRAVKKLKTLGQGVGGEIFVGQLLEGLRSDGCKVYHDIPGDGFNVDHVAIGPQGVFAFETKTISKPLKGDAKIIYDGQAISVGGYQPDRDPIGQAEAEARHIREILRKMCGKDQVVQPVVLYPGWFVECTNNFGKVTVANPTHFLLSFERLHPEVLDEDEVNFLSANFERYLREAK